MQVQLSNSQEVSYSAQCFSSGSIASEFQFAGWIPCVAGRLHFDVADCNLGEEDSRHKFMAKAPKESGGFAYWLTLDSIVDWKDREKGDGRWQVIVIAHAENDSELSGFVFIFPRANHDLFSLQLNILSKLNVADFTDKPSIEKAFEDTKESLLNCDEKEFYRISFKILKSGITFLSAEKAGDDKLHDSYVLCRQSFYYLKFAFHKHKHHPDSVDSLTTVHATGKDVGMELIFDLKKSLIDINRDLPECGARQDNNLKGINSYLRSLVQTCYCESLIDEKEYKQEICYLENTERSYDAALDKNEQIRVLNFNSRSEGRQVLTVFFALLAPWAIIAARDANYKSSLVSQVLSEIYTSDYKSFMFVLFVFLIYFVTKLSTYRFASFSGFASVVYGAVKFIVREKHKALVLAVMLILIGGSIIGNVVYQTFFIL